MPLTRPSIMLLLGLLALSLAVLPGCRREVRTEADALREQVIDLEREVRRLERRNRELERQAAAAAETCDLDPALLRAIPHVAEITVGRLSHGRDTTGDGAADLLRIYIQPADGEGRFTPLTGELRVTAALQPEEGEATTIGRVRLSPEEVRDRYRSGFTGTHYTVELPIEPPADADPATLAQEAEALVRVDYTDGLTGKRLSTQRTVRLQSPPSPRAEVQIN